MAPFHASFWLLIGDSPTNIQNKHFATNQGPNHLGSGAYFHSRLPICLCFGCSPIVLVILLHKWAECLFVFSTNEKQFFYSMTAASFCQSHHDAFLLLYGWRLLMRVHILQGEGGGCTVFRMNSWVNMSECLKWPSGCWLSLHLCPKGLIVRFGWRALRFLNEKSRGWFVCFSL